ncbi:hypothetical protein BC828DRAFT_227508 [Blastocladiella britannica]|nr:hypothetical protein BC828DRAFT_227508 [Blastocladiella britannica]
MTIWSPTVVSSCLYVFLVTAFGFLIVNTRECFRRKAPFMSMFTLLAIGSLFLVLHQGIFLVLADGPADKLWGGCDLWRSAEPVMYLSIQAIFTTCLILRSTAILRVNVDGPWYLSKNGVRGAMFFVFAIAFCLVFASILFATTGVDTVANRCIYIPLALVNNPGKICTFVLYYNCDQVSLSKTKTVYFLLYTSIIMVFLSTMKKHVKAMSAHAPPQSSTMAYGTASAHTPPTSAGTNDPTQPLRRLMSHMTGRVVLAMMVYLVTALVGFADGFSGGVLVGFALQNQAAAMAVTMAMASRRSSSSSSSSSSSGSAPNGVNDSRIGTAVNPSRPIQSKPSAIPMV